MNEKYKWQCYKVTNTFVHPLYVEIVASTNWKHIVLQLVYEEHLKKSKIWYKTKKNSPWNFQNVISPCLESFMQSLEIIPFSF